MENFFAIFADTLKQADADFGDTLSCRVFVTEAAHVETVARLLGERFGPVTPTTTALICGIPVPGRNSK